MFSVKFSVQYNKYINDTDFKHTVFTSRKLAGGDVTGHTYAPHPPSSATLFALNQAKADSGRTRNVSDLQIAVQECLPTYLPHI